MLLGTLLMLQTHAALEQNVAYADMYGFESSPVTDAVPNELQMRIESSAQAYNDANAQIEELESIAQSCQEKIAEIDRQLPEVRDEASRAIRAHYKYQLNSHGLLDLILSAEDFSSFVSMIAYLNGVEEYNSQRIAALVELHAELESQQAMLESSLAEARIQRDEAAAALAEAQAARAEAQRIAEEKAREEAARLQAIAEQAAAEQAAVEAAAAQRATETQDTGTTEAQQSVTPPVEEPTVTPTEPTPQEPAEEENKPVEIPEEPVEPETPQEEEPEYIPEENPEEYIPEEEYYEEPAENVEDNTSSQEVDWSDDRSVFIAEWGARIDAYLGYSPLGGYGSVFAAAAWDYGIDPRFSPAISCVESGKGAVCFLPYNAWGWGSSVWSSWEEAIYAHVAGLSRGYGYTVTYEGACRYCPPTADLWYEMVVAQMSLI